MPLYEYSCADCGNQSEQLVMGGEKVLCPECQGSHMERQFSLPARPGASQGSLLAGCDPSLPPCNPACCRLPPG
ncbi:MAG: zinc ribbon domain-containing protein [Planctomycetota bacterium]|nr:zinc ribbon domain-containing protein [Planctomycetota bacterium]